jgi:hypothetical protein
MYFLPILFALVYLSRAYSSPINVSEGEGSSAPIFLEPLDRNQTVGAVFNRIGGIPNDIKENISEFLVPEIRFRIYDNSGIESTLWSNTIQTVNQVMNGRARVVFSRDRETESWDWNHRMISVEKYIWEDFYYFYSPRLNWNIRGESPFSSLVEKCLFSCEELEISGKKVSPNP